MAGDLSLLITFGQTAATWWLVRMAFTVALNTMG